MSQPTNEYEDPIYKDAKLFTISRENVSPASLQRHFLIGYNRAARLIEAMEQEGVISSADHFGRRTIIKGGQND